MDSPNDVCCSPAVWVSSRGWHFIQRPMPSFRRRLYALVDIYPRGWQPHTRRVRPSTQYQHRPRCCCRILLLCVYSHLLAELAPQESMGRVGSRHRCGIPSRHHHVCRHLALQRQTFKTRPGIQGATGNSRRDREFKTQPVPIDINARVPVPRIR